MLAVGCSDGYVRILEVESEAQVFEEQLVETEVSSISWSRADPAANPNQYVDRAKRLLHPLKPLVKQGNLEKPQTRQLDPEHLEVDGNKPVYFLICGAVDGNIVLCVHGQFSLGRLNMCQVTPELSQQSLQIVDTHLSTDLQSLSVIYRATGSTAQTATLGLIELDTSAMCDTQAEIVHVISQMLHCQSVLLYIESISNQIGSQWQSAMEEVRDKMKPLSDLIRDSGTTTSPREELLSMLCCGQRTHTNHPPLKCSNCRCGECAAEPVHLPEAPACRCECILPSCFPRV